jgi:hypothetical protein
MYRVLGLHSCQQPQTISAGFPNGGARTRKKVLNNACLLRPTGRDVLFVNVRREAAISADARKVGES